MIQVVCSPEECSVQITGHAGSGPKGQDLVCAAVSILVLTLEENVGKMAMHQMLEDYSVELSEGLACICCCPKPEYRMPVDMVLMSICTGFNLLAEKWPEYVSCRIVSGYAKHVGGTSHLQHCHADNRCEDQLRAKSRPSVGCTPRVLPSGAASTSLGMTALYRNCGAVEKTKCGNAGG